MSIVETEMSAVQRAHVAREGLHFFTLRTLPFEGLDLANDLVPTIQHPMHLSSAIVSVIGKAYV